MKAKFCKFLLNRFQLTSKKRQKAGFTLLELLVSTMIGAIIVTALLSFVVDLLQTDRKEYVNSSTQQEIQAALDFIADDLREAVYIYDNIEDKRDGINALKDFLPPFDNKSYTPVLAFWKVERVPYDKPDDNFNCSGPPDACTEIQTRRRAYTLVVYYQVENSENDDKWKGKSRIVRYHLRKYKDVGSLQYNDGYVDPVGMDSRTSKYTDPGSWPIDTSSRLSIQSTKPSVSPPPPVLVDFVDDPKPDDPNLNPIKDNKEMTTCNSTSVNSPLYTPSGSTQPNYRRVPKDPNEYTSFFVCVKTLDSTRKDDGSMPGGVNQDAIIYLRGNVKKQNEKTTKTTPLVTLKTQAAARGIVDKGK